MFQAHIVLAQARSFVSNVGSFSTKSYEVRIRLNRRDLVTQEGKTLRAKGITDLLKYRPHTLDTINNALELAHTPGEFMKRRYVFYNTVRMTAEGINRWQQRFQEAGELRVTQEIGEHFLTVTDHR